MAEYYNIQRPWLFSSLFVLYYNNLDILLILLHTKIKYDVRNMVLLFEESAKLTLVYLIKYM